METYKVGKWKVCGPDNVIHDLSSIGQGKCLGVKMYMDTEYDGDGVMPTYCLFKRLDNEEPFWATIVEDKARGDMETKFVVVQPQDVPQEIIEDEYPPKIIVKRMFYHVLYPIPGGNITLFRICTEGGEVKENQAYLTAIGEFLGEKTKEGDFCVEQFMVDGATRVQSIPLIIEDEWKLATEEDKKDYEKFVDKVIMEKLRVFEDKWGLQVVRIEFEGKEIENAEQ